MSDIIIIIILVLILGIALWGSIKHFRGEGGCCGGGSTKPKKKKLNGKIVQTYTLHIEGMHCENCANRVMSAINAIDGVSAKVKQKKKEATVYCIREVDIEEMIQSIENKGYRVISYNSK